MFSIKFLDLLAPGKLGRLTRQAEDEIKIRGYDGSRVSISPDLGRSDWFLPVNEIVSDYCMTDRYSYIRKFKRNTPYELTWGRVKGTLIDNIYEELLKAFTEYTNSQKIKNFNVLKDFEHFISDKKEEIRKQIDKDKDKIIDEDIAEEKIEEFLLDIEKLLHFEIQLCSSIVNFKISTKRDINLKSEVALLFPFVLKPKLVALGLGFSGSSEPDFIYGGRVIGDIKTGDWRNSFNLACAAYALAYENENEENLNLGVILNPSFDKKRCVPLYSKSKIEIIHDGYRKVVLALRNKKIGMIKKGVDPGSPSDEKSCCGCGYFNYCWSSKE